MTNQIAYEEQDLLPINLKSTQEWFANVITYPLGENNTIQPYTQEGLLLAEEAGKYITPSQTLRPYQRMQIYNQQYWWRLLNTLHVNFPLLTRLFGSHAFNEKIGIPYLFKYPPNQWSLSSLGERLPKWVEEDYREPDRSLIYHAANLDWGFTSSFIAPQLPRLDLAPLIQDNPDKLLSCTFYLQPHIHLFSWDYDLFSFREAFLKENADYWVEHRFPDLPKGKIFRFILYRNVKNNIGWREITEGEYILLEQFKKGTTIPAACECIEAQESGLYEQAASNLQKWLQEWTQMGWLTFTQK
jgi:putative DNA-binding protein